MHNERGTIVKTGIQSSWTHVISTSSALDEARDGMFFVPKRNITLILYRLSAASSCAVSASLATSAGMSILPNEGSEVSLLIERPRSTEIQGIQANHGRTRTTRIFHYHLR